MMPAHQSDVIDDVACIGCGCTDHEACPGGCSWAPNEVGVDICSRCVARAIEEAYPLSVQEVRER
jgi:Fe-S-cluster-containing dehydrogenase component